MEGRAPEDHFFPAFADNGVLHWEQPLQPNTYLTMLRGCVTALGLESDPHKVKLYNSTSIRVGNTNLTEASVAQFRAQRNRQLGWADGSRMPEVHYTSASVALAPGPLFWDIEACDAKFDQHVRESQLKKFSSMLCTQCGSPFPANSAACDCAYCSEKARYRAAGSGTNPKCKHTCWRAQVKTSGVMPEEVKSELVSKWSALGCTLQLHWDTSEKVYTFL